MIIELFGPPGAGKTTFALALAESLNGHGIAAETRLSARPGEDATGTRVRRPPSRLEQWIAPMSRVSRATFELWSATGSVDRAAWSGPMIERIVAAMPPNRLLQAWRIRQYLVRLAASWSRAQASRFVVIFDQAWVQAIGLAIVDTERLRTADFAALAGLTSTSKVAEISSLIEASPQSDLAIAVAAPRAEIERRLAQRGRDMGRIGALLEARDVCAAEQMRAVARLLEGLAAHGRNTLQIDCGDREALCQDVARAEAEIMRLRRTAGGAAPIPLAG